MRAGIKHFFVKQLRSQTEERRVVASRGFRLHPADVAGAEVIGYYKQVRSGQTMLAVILDLFLSQMRHSFSFVLTSGVPEGFSCRSWRKLLRITISHKKHKKHKRHKERLTEQ
jgi:hypothetical protein